MRGVAFVVGLQGALSVAATESDAACDAARRELERHARDQGLQVEVRCRANAGVSLSSAGPSEKAVRASPWSPGVAPQSGALTWPVQISDGSAAGRTRRIPLTVTWTGPAWVATRTLAPGAWLQDGDVTMRSMRWPEGVPVQPARGDQPPAGRLRLALHADDILLPHAFHAAGTVLRGDRMTAVLQQGAIELRWPAALLASSRIGQSGVARIVGRAAPAAGRIADAQTFILEP